MAGLEPNEGMRINKFMSDAGICSRREADRLVEEGKVLIDGIPAEVGARVYPGQKVTVAGQQATVTPEEEKVILAYNKPKGVECTSDRTNPDNIIDKIGYSKRVYTIGRLDKSSCGLILLTNDGDMAYRISKAGDNHEKEYIVRVDRPFDDEFLLKMAAGVPLEEKRTAPCRISRINEQMFRIVLIQGLNRQIRRMCEYFDYKVVYLKRIRVMNILLGDLEPGTYREITPREQDELRRMLDGKVSVSGRVLGKRTDGPHTDRRPAGPSTSEKREERFDRGPARPRTPEEHERHFDRGPARPRTPEEHERHFDRGPARPDSHGRMERAGANTRHEERLEQERAEKRSGFLHRERKPLDRETKDGRPRTGVRRY